jgi:hypothetical protein
MSDDVTVTPRKRPLQMGALQQELSLVASHPLLALPEAAAIVMRHLDADAAAWVAAAPRAAAAGGAVGGRAGRAAIGGCRRDRGVSNAGDGKEGPKKGKLVEPLG